MPMPRPSWPRRYTTTPRSSSATFCIGGRELRAAIAAQRAEHVAGQALAVHPHEHVLGPLHVAAHERDVVLAVEHRLEHDALELAELRRDRRLGEPADELLVLAPVADEVGDRDEQQAVLVGEPFELGRAGHVHLLLVDDLAQHAGRVQTGEPCARSTVASVWPARFSTPPSRASSGRMWPGRARSSGACRGIDERLDRRRRGRRPRCPCWCRGGSRPTRGTRCAGSRCSA